jgi:thiosulfate dehydrogenase [quinone] large subunit
MSDIMSERVRKNEIRQLEDSPIARALFATTRWAWIWLLLRLYLGYEWLVAGWGKVNNPAWVGANAGTALSGFVNGALQKTAGEHPDVQGWYAAFLQNIVLPNASIFSYLVAFGELLVGVALILGIFTGIAAFFGLFMNASYLLAGAVSTNPIMLAIAIFLILAWKVAGWWGLDRFVLPALGTPWRPGLLFRQEDEIYQPHTTNPIPQTGPQAIQGPIDDEDVERS